MLTLHVSPTEVLIEFPLQFRPVTRGGSTYGPNRHRPPLLADKSCKFSLFRLFWGYLGVISATRPPFYISWIHPCLTCVLASLPTLNHKDCDPVTLLYNLPPPGERDLTLTWYTYKCLPFGVFFFFFFFKILVMGGFSSHTKAPNLHIILVYFEQIIS